MSTLSDIAQTLLTEQKGILAADQPEWSVRARLRQFDVTAHEDTYRNWCDLLFTTPNLSDDVSGIIMHRSAVDIKMDDGTSLIDVVINNGMYPGISPSLGLVPLPGGAAGEVIGRGLDRLREQFEEYAEMGFKFAKWRAPFEIGDGTPTDYCIQANAFVLAQFAAYAQEAGLVPIIEPEVVYAGTHSIEACFAVTERVLRQTFEAMYLHRVELEGLLLKTNMVLPGKDSGIKAAADDVAEMTVKVLRRAVPAAVPGIVFLSGGQYDYQATVHLQKISKFDNPWKVTFSYARALQRAPLEAWQDNPLNFSAGQEALKHRTHMNALASVGKWRHKYESGEETA